MTTTSNDTDTDTPEPKEVRYFLAHAKSDPDEIIDAWRDAAQEALTETHAPQGMAPVVIPGRDDFNERAAALGGWKPWGASIADGVRWDGTPLFDGILVPVGLDANSRILGRATYDMVEGMLAQGKWCYALIVGGSDLDFAEVIGVERLPGDSWKAWGRVTLAE